MPPAYEKIIRGALKYKQSGAKDVLREQMKGGTTDAAGPQPHALFFTCMDSRLMPTKFTQTHDGSTMFIIRNAGNMVPPATINCDESASKNTNATTVRPTIATEPAALELAAIHCDIHHVVVCGHSDCKAMKSLHDTHTAAVDASPTSPLASCLKHFGEASLRRFRHYQQNPDMPLKFNQAIERQAFSAVIDPHKQWNDTDRLSQVHTLQQLENIASHPVLHQVLSSGTLRLHAMWFCVSTGDVFFFKKQMQQFVPLDEQLAERLLAQP